MIHNTKFSEASFYQGWKKEECSEEKITNLFVETFTFLVKDAELRKASYKNDVRVLEAGFWYPIDYFIFLKETNQKEKINLFKENDFFFHGVPPKGFKQVQESNYPTECKPFSYELDGQTAASKGLENCQSTFCIIDCQMLIEIALYEICHQVMGTSEFNKYFNAQGKSGFRLDPNIWKTPLVNFFKETTYSFHSLTTEVVHKGDIVYFRNIPAYCEIHSNEDSQGFHAVCIEDRGERKFTAFGISSEGVSNIGMLEFLANEMNKDRIEDSWIYSEKVIEAKTASRGEIACDGFLPVNKMKYTKEDYSEMHDFHPELVGLDNEITYLDINFLKTLCK